MGALAAGPRTWEIRKISPALPALRFEPPTTGSRPSGPNRLAGWTTHRIKLHGSTIKCQHRYTLTPFSDEPDPCSHLHTLHQVKESFSSNQAACTRVRTTCRAQCCSKMPPASGSWVLQAAQPYVVLSGLDEACGRAITDGEWPLILATFTGLDLK